MFHEGPPANDDNGSQLWTVGWRGLSPLEKGTAVIPISQGNLISCLTHKQGAVEYQDLNPGSLAEGLRLGQFYFISHRE